MKTTLNQIKENDPCVSGYRKLLTFLGKTKADDEPLALSTILESNGVLDTVWCFRAVSGFDREMRLFAVFCARQVQHLMTDPRSIAAIDVAERYANGNATDAELTAASDAAYDAARDAAFRAAYSASHDAARAAANATYDDAEAAANAAVRAARSADPEIQSILESYLKNLLSEK